MSGFWAGAVPPWAWVVGGIIGLLLLLAGIWVGYGRGWAHAEEERKLERKQFGPRIGKIRDRRLLEQALAWLSPPEVAHEAWTAHIEQAMNLADPSWSAESARAITTGEIQAITYEMDAWLAVHVYGAPKDYGQWLEQQDR